MPRAPTARTAPTAWTGAAGATGPKGDPGTDGTNGLDGAAGATGPKGDKGDPGTNGTNGAQGPQGPQGPPGSGGNVVWARVNIDGSLSSGSGVVGTGQDPVSLAYHVDFDRDVTNCAIVATAHRHPLSGHDGVSVEVFNHSSAVGGGARVYVQPFRGYAALSGVELRVSGSFAVVANC